MPAGGYAILVGYRDTTAGPHAEACWFTIMVPPVTNALLPGSGTRIRSALIWFPRPSSAIRPLNAASIVTKMASEAVVGNLKVARRSRVTGGSSPHIVDYCHISTIGCHVYACRFVTIIPASAEAGSEASLTRRRSRGAGRCCWPGRCCSRETRFHTFATGKR